MATFVFFLDRLSKFLVLRGFEPNESRDVIKNIFAITLVQNTGAAFGIFKNQIFVFTAISALAVIFIIIYIRKKKEASFLSDLALALILGGALGNLADRLVFGYVVDFLDFKIWPVFNVADSAITIGVFLLVINMLRRNVK